MAGPGLGLEQQIKLSCSPGTDAEQAAWQTKVAGMKKAELPCG